MTDASGDAKTRGKDLAERLEAEAEQFRVVESDTDAIHVETKTVEGEHRVWFTSGGPRLHDKGIYRLKGDGSVEIEVDCPKPDELREHFRDEFGGSAHRSDR